mmetsp:Transcript_9506/g.23931  ORF Transcript_9506/g.23931 Transcript_9506/m.23931 type:complete len:283 (+) Transcript_9506:59-907(+)
MARLAVFASCSMGATAFAPAPGALRSSALAPAGAPVGAQLAAVPGAEGAAAFGQNAAVAAVGVAAVASAAMAVKSRSRVARNAQVVTYVDGKARFVTAGGAAAASAGTFSPESQLGVLAPTGFWDPLGFCDGITEMEFKRLRSCEIKHGRLAMMATIGFITPFYSKLPGYLSPSASLKFADIDNGLGAVSQVPSAGWAQILIFAALCEFGPNPKMEEWRTGAPGDYGKGFLGMFGPVMDPEKKKRSLSAEISNGRLAMMAITGMVVQNGITGTTDSAMWFGS